VVDPTQSGRTASTFDFCYNILNRDHGTILRQQHTVVPKHLKLIKENLRPLNCSIHTMWMKVTIAKDWRQTVAMLNSAWPSLWG